MWALNINRWNKEEDKIFFIELERFYNREIKFSQMAFILAKKLDKTYGEILWYYGYIIRTVENEMAYFSEKDDFIKQVNDIDETEIPSVLDKSAKTVSFF